jgi:hypothetical protein
VDKQQGGYIMTNAQHTPGPWQLGQPNLYFDGHTPIDSPFHGGIVQVVTKMEDDDTRKEAELAANARLIAAAPELLQGLLDALQEIDIEIEQRKHSGNDEHWEDLESVSNRGHAAIANVTGQAA